MPVPTLISELSTTAASNSPVGSVDVPSTLDNYQRAHASFIAQLRDSVADIEDGTTTVVNATNATTATTATAANGIKTATTTVVTSSGAAPTAGQVLTAIDSTSASFQTPASGGVTSVVGQTGAVSTAQIMTALQTVDGSSSGLDADLLDGQHGSYYLTSNVGAGGVGAFMLLAHATANTAIVAGTTYAGSALRTIPTYTDLNIILMTGALANVLSGSWVAMNAAPAVSTSYAVANFQRIS